MKKIKFYNILILLLTAIGTASFMTSCTYDESDELAGKGPSIIRMQVAPGDYDVNFGVAAFDAVKQTRTILIINRDAVDNGDLNTTVTVNFAIDTEPMDLLNDSLDVNGSDPFEILPVDSYKWNVGGLSGTTLTFAAGEFAKEIAIDLDPTNLDFSAKYALPLRITGPSGSYTVSNVFGYAVIQVIVKNAYDGVYSYSGSMGRWDASGAALNDGLDGTVGDGISTELVTASDTEVDFSPLWASGGGVGGVGVPRIKVNPDNSIVLTTPGVTVANWGPIPGGDNYYDPDTQTFYVNYKWGAASGSPTGTTRAMMVVMKYNGSR